ncbi:MAG: LPS assembly lipoprotein LptE [bacterium]|nr:LPS assembly lipoprotein LptE [bacterium]
MDCRFRTFIKILYLFLIIVQVGCFRYSFTGSMPPHLKTVAVITLEDRTAELGLREKLTDAIVEAYRNDNTLRITDPTSADAILSGEVSSLLEAPYSFTAAETVTETRVTISIRIKLEDKIKNKVLYEGVLSAFGGYGSASSTNSNRDAAIDEAIKKLASEVVTKTLSGW